MILWFKQIFTKNIYVKSSQPRRSQRFINNVVLPLPDLPIINPLIPLGSRGDYIVCWGFHSKRDFLLPFFIFIIFLIFPYNKNVLFIVSTCNRNWKYHYCYVQKWQTHEAKPMLHMYKLRHNSSKEMLLVEVFLIS